MKKIFTYIIIAAAMTFAASCAEEHIGGVDNSDATVTLRLQTSEMDTRATVTETGNVIAGVGAENTLTHADFFFFSDSEGENLINHVRLTVGTDPSGLVAAGTNIYEHKFDVSDAENPLQNASYVYVLANYPSEITATAGETTLADILDYDINIDLSGTVSAFVMDSYADGSLTYLSPSKTADSKTFTIGLKRAAAKLVLNFNVKDEFEDAAGNVWTPVLDQMWVNFVNARKVGKVAAEPVAFDAKANYFTTSQVAPTSVTSAKEGYSSWSHPAVYTYPQQYKTSDVTAPYYKIFIPWVCEKKGQNNFYYKIILPELGSFKRNKIYKLTVDVSVIGGTEDDWALVTEYVYVADWWAPEKIESSVEGAMYLDVPVKFYEIYGIDYVDIPVASSNEIEVTATGTKQNLYGNGGNGVPTDVTVTPSITIAEDGKSSFKLTHVLDNNMYITQGNNKVRNPNFDFTPITYTITVKHTTGGLSKTVTVTVIQYPSIYAQRDPSNGYAYVNSYAYTNNHGGRHNDSDLAYNNYNGNQTRNDYNYRILGSMADINDSGNQNSNQYVVYISVLPKDYSVAGLSDKVIIGDPRGGTLSDNYLGYTSGTNGSYDQIVQGKYDAVSSTTPNIIAPAIRIASSWGATMQIVNYDRAEERCAAYQENGYPAGRWRVPTVAEIDFLIQLSTYEHIPALFTTVYSTSGNTDHYRGYWAGGRNLYLGKPYTDAGYSAPFENMTDATQTGSNAYYYMYDYLRLGSYYNYTYYQARVRCVYDEWYWGSTKYGNNGQPTGTAATQWIGYIF